MVPPASVNPWIEVLLPLDPEHIQGRHSLCLALAMMGRKTENPELDLSAGIREKIRERLNTLHCPENWMKMLEGTPDQEEEGTLEATFGDSLPLGLRLAETTSP